MGWIDGITAGFYNWKTQLIQQMYSNIEHTYVNPEDDEEDDTDEYEWTTTVVVGEPMRPTKCLFVPEMNDFYTDQELNTIYHSADEYRNAVRKYGFIYKSQKFQNASTVQQLFDYAKDWIKNNYHGGITNFNISALDMHLTNPDFDKYLVGQRVDVQYIDPAIREETSQTLTVISAEYDLNNPDKNNYKIGIPDVTLNKVYGETSKKGGGGGGGGKTSDQTGNETDTEVEGLIDNAEEQARQQTALTWGCLYQGTRDGEAQIGDLEIPGEKDQTSDFVFGLTSDISKSSLFQGVRAQIDSIKSQYLSITGGIDGEKISMNHGNITTLASGTVTASEGINSKKDATIENKTTTKTLDVTENANIDNKVTCKDVESTGSGTFADLEVTGTGNIHTLKVNGTTIRFAVSGGKPRLTIGGSTFTLVTE